MNAIRIRKKLEAATLNLPELDRFVGKTVEIIVLEEADVPVVTPGTGDFAAWPALIADIREHYDFEAVRKQREYDLLHANKGK